MATTTIITTDTTTAMAMASIPAAARDSQTCTLPDGRTVGFAEYGAPDGHPVLYFHGFPSSRLEASMTDKQARRHHVRVLALDRPGMGLSTRQPGRTTLDYADDVLAFAAAQNLPRFGILGMSGGGPYALACASQIPASRLSHVGVMAGAGPWSRSRGGLRAVPTQMRVVGLLTHHCPWVLRTLIAGVAGSLQWLARTPVVTQCVDLWLAHSVRAAQEAREAQRAKQGRVKLSDKTAKAEKEYEKEYEKEKENIEPVIDMEASMVGGDYEEVGASVTSLWASEASQTRPVANVVEEENDKEEDEDEEDDDEDVDPDAGLTIPERREKLYRRLFGAFQQGPDGVIDDALVICNEPAYQPEAITYNPIVFWHGDRDANVPLAWVKPTVDRIPHSILKVFYGRNHFTIAEDLDEIMSFYDPRLLSGINAR